MLEGMRQSNLLTYPLNRVVQNFVDSCCCFQILLDLIEEWWQYQYTPQSALSRKKMDGSYVAEGWSGP